MDGCWVREGERSTFRVLTPYKTPGWSTEPSSLKSHPNTLTSNRMGLLSNMTKLQPCSCKTLWSQRQKGHLKGTTTPRMKGWKLQITFLTFKSLRATRPRLLWKEVKSGVSLKERCVDDVGRMASSLHLSGLTSQLPLPAASFCPLPVRCVGYSSGPKASRIHMLNFLSSAAKAKHWLWEQHSQQTKCFCHHQLLVFQWDIFFLLSWLKRQRFAWLNCPVTVLRATNKQVQDQTPLRGNFHSTTETISWISFLFSKE